MLITASQLNKNPRGDISLITVLIITSILLIAAASLTASALSAVNNSNAKTNTYAAEARAKACIQEGINKLRVSSTYTGTLNLTYSNSSSCSATISNGSSANIKNIDVTATSNGYTYENIKTVNTNGLQSGYSYQDISNTNVLGATNTPSSVTWYQPYGATNSPDDKNSAYNLATASVGMTQGQISAGNYYTLLSANGLGGTVDYKISSTGLSSLTVSGTYMNQLDGVSRSAIILYSKDNGSTFANLASAAIAGTTTAGTVVSGTANFGSTIGGTVILRFMINTSTAGGSDKVGWSNITINPTSTTFDFIPRIGSEVNVDPTVLVSTSTVTGATPNPYQVAMQGKYLYLINSATNNFMIYDASIPGVAPSLISTTTTSTTPKTIVVSGKYAFVGTNNSATVQAWDISNPFLPVSVNTQAVGGAAGSTNGPKWMINNGKNLIVSNPSNATVQILDEQNPSSGQPILSTITIASNLPNAIAVQGKYLYVSYSNAGQTSNFLNIYDISNPASPSAVVSAFAVGTTIFSSAVQGRYLYLVGGTSGGNDFYIVDISNPAIPVITNSSKTGINVAYGLSIQNRIAYAVGLSSTIFQPIDVSIPTSPTLLNPGTISAGANNLTVQGKYAYVPMSSSNVLGVIDLGGIYSQQFEAGSIDAATLNVRNGLTSINGSFYGHVNVALDLGVSGNAYIASTLTTNGAATFNSTTSTTGVASFADNNGIQFPNTNSQKIGLAGTNVGIGVNSGLYLYGNAGNSTLSWKGQNGAAGANVWTVSTNGTECAGGLLCNGVDATYSTGNGTIYKSGVGYVVMEDASNSYLNAPTAAGLIYFRQNNVTQGSFDALHNLIINNKIGLGGNVAPAVSLDVTGAGQFTSTVTATGFPVSSSLRYKDNIKSLGYSLNDLMKLKPVSYYYKKAFPGYSANHQVGLIAEDVALVYPEAVSYKDGQVDAVDYGKFAPLLIQSVQELKKEIDGLKASLNPINKTQSTALQFFDLNNTNISTKFNISTVGTINAKDMIASGSLKALDVTSKCNNGNDKGLITCASIAQKYSASEQTQMGDIVELNKNSINQVNKSSLKSNLILGVVTPYAAIVLGLDGSTKSGGDSLSEITSSSTIVAFSGKTITNVSNEKGNIKVGDAITSSSIPGVGMRAGPLDPIVGIALENFTGTSGKIIVLLSKSR